VVLIAVGLAILGFLIGASFQLRSLLLTAAVLFLATLGFACSHGYDLLQTMCMALGAQTILQTSYFLGLVALDRSYRFLSRRASGDTLFAIAPQRPFLFTVHGLSNKLSGCHASGPVTESSRLASAKTDCLAADAERRICLLGD